MARKPAHAKRFAGSPAFLFLAAVAVAAPAFGEAASSDNSWDVKSVNGLISGDYQYMLEPYDFYSPDNPEGGIIPNKAGFRLESKGTLVADPKIKNGTVSSAGLRGVWYAPQPCAGYLKSVRLSLSGRFETVQLSKEFIPGMAAQSGGFDAAVRTELLSGPLVALVRWVDASSATMRAVHGIRLDAGYYVSRARDAAPAAKPPTDRFNMGSELELPYRRLILRGAWQYSKELAFSRRDFRCYELMGGIFIGNGKDPSPKNQKRYVFLKWSKGPKAPDFLDAEETAIGFAAFF